MSNDIRLIEANALEVSIRAYADRKCANGDAETANGILKALSCVRSAPTISPETLVRRGTWVEIEDENATESRCFCSHCGFPISIWHKSKSCPSCGARMDGDLK